MNLRAPAGKIRRRAERFPAIAGLAFVCCDLNELRINALGAAAHIGATAALGSPGPQLKFGERCPSIQGLVNSRKTRDFIYSTFIKEVALGSEQWLQFMGT